jgi:hypothetical protein
VDVTGLDLEAVHGEQAAQHRELAEVVVGHDRDVEATLGPRSDAQPRRPLRRERGGEAEVRGHVLGLLALPVLGVEPREERARLVRPHLRTEAPERVEELVRGGRDSGRSRHRRRL